MESSMPDERGGAFIVIEGIDGSGTTTHTRLLAEWLRDQGLEVESTCEPSDGPVGRLVREALGRPSEGSPLSWAVMALLFAADRMDHAERTILPATRSGKWVVCDRFDLSSIVYQSVTAATSQSVVAWIRELNLRAPRPELTVVLDVAPEVAEKRRLRRGGIREIYDDAELQARLAQAYSRAEELVPEDPVVHVRAEPPVAEVAARVADAVRATGLLSGERTGGANLPKRS
jgi:dTMP kinase